MTKWSIIFLIFSGCSFLEEKPDSPLPLIVLTFDDGSHTIYDLAFQEMKKYNFNGVNYIPTAFVDKPGSMTLAQCQEMEHSGWETGGHTVSHANLTTLPMDSVRSEVRRNFNDLVRMGLRHRTFALPAGHGNDEILEIIKQWFQIIRNSQNYRYQLPLNTDRLGYYQVQDNDDVNSLMMRVNHGILEEEGMVIFGFHTFTEAQPQFITEINISVFKGFLKELKQKNVEVVTLSVAVDRLK